MSVRIYQLSKQIGMENSELIELLRSRGFDIKSASSTIDNISAESLVEEYTKAEPEEEKPSEEEAKKEAEKAKSKKEEAPKKPALPPGVFVKSKQDVEREREEKLEAENAAKKEAEARKAGVKKAPPAPAAPPPAKPTGSKPPPLPSAPGMGSAPKPVSPAAMRNAPPASPPPMAPSIAAKGGSDGSAAKPNIPGVKTKEEVAVEKQKAVESKAAGTLVSSPVPPQGPAVPPPVAPNAPGSPGVVTPQRTDSSKPETLAPLQVGGETEAGSSEPGAEKVLQLKVPIVVRDFAEHLNLKPFRLISELMELGIFASMNQVIEEDVAIKLATKHGYTLEIRHRGEQEKKPEAPKKKKIDESKLLEPRPPVVCILGHVDHGKTTLLDTIRKTNVVSGEAGGITQHIGAYQIEHNDHRITFIDTPGHAAFSKMRERGADVTDIAVLVVAADDGFMPQTDEALKFAQNSGVPLIVAVNKMDVRGANIDRVKTQMQERNIAPEDWGGETITVPISAIKGDGIENLLEMLLLQSEIMELKANPKCPSEGVIIEAQKEVGRGSTASVIVTKGTLKVGDALLSGPHYCKVRSLIDDKGKSLKKAPPSTPVKVVGWTGAAEAGTEFSTVKNERTAKKEAEAYAHDMKMGKTQDAVNALAAEGPSSLDKLFQSIEKTRTRTYKVIVKSDVYGTAEALAACLEEIESDKIDLEVVQIAVGAISKNDVQLASASGASIVGFNISLENGVRSQAKHDGVDIILNNIIYEVIDLVKDAMVNLLEPELRESKIGAAEVRQVFEISRGMAAGCLVTEGKVVRDGLAHLIRKGKVISEGKMVTLKRFKEDATEVRAGYECGIKLDSTNDYKEGDIIEAFEILKIKPTL